MAILFNFREFGHPAALLRLQRSFQKNQWLPEGKLVQRQMLLLKAVLRQAGGQVPYYRELFEKLRFDPEGLRSQDEIRGLPLLTKDLLREKADVLHAPSLRSYAARMISTSGTTGEPVSFYVDRRSNLLEFVYYWRFWGWHGYRLGNPFAELSVEWFAKRGRAAALLAERERITGRLWLNSLLVDREHIGEIAAALRAHRPRFLKGSPSALFVLALLWREAGLPRTGFKAIFSQGEQLLPLFRRTIEETFAAPVFDSYGHLERTVAISQCPQGRYHVHSDYGLTEFLPADPEDAAEAKEGEQLARVVSTSLHNFAMPLIRYVSGDAVWLRKKSQPCPCGRTFPTVERIVGRCSAMLVTPARRIITAPFLAFHETPHLSIGQIVQEQLEEVHVSYDCPAEHDGAVRAALAANMRAMVGPEMSLVLERKPWAEIRGPVAKKFRSVISRVPWELAFE